MLWLSNFSHLPIIKLQQNGANKQAFFLFSPLGYVLQFGEQEGRQWRHSIVLCGTRRKTRLSAVPCYTGKISDRISTMHSVPWHDKIRTTLALFPGQSWYGPRTETTHIYTTLLFLINFHFGYNTDRGWNEAKTLQSAAKYLNKPFSRTL